MSQTANTTLDYARPPRRGRSAFREPEAFLATAANVLLATLAVAGVRGLLSPVVGIAAGLAIVAVATLLTVTVIAALGVVEAIACGPPSAVRRRRAWVVFAITAGHLTIFLCAVAWAVYERA